MNDKLKKIGFFIILIGGAVAVGLYNYLKFSSVQSFYRSDVCMIVNLPIILVGLILVNAGNFPGMFTVRRSVKILLFFLLFVWVLVSLTVLWGAVGGK